MSLNKTSTPSLADKQKALSLAVAGIEKQFGKGAIMTLGNKAAFTCALIEAKILSEV